MIENAFRYINKLSRPFEYLRADLYIVNVKIYFGELTFMFFAELNNIIFPEIDKFIPHQIKLLI